MEEKPTGFFTRRPWVFVVLAFGVLVALWSAAIFVSVKNRPEKIPVPESVRP
jgi:hypothetical protein